MALRKLALGALGVAAAVGLWGLIATQTTASILPGPTAVLEAIRRDFTGIPAVASLRLDSGGILENLIYTMNSVFLGVSLGAAIGFSLGMVIAKVRIARELVEPPLLLMMTVPLVILQPFILIWFGTARVAQAGLVIMYAAVTITITTQQATYNVAGRFQDYASSLGARGTRLVTSVIVPAVLPEVIGAIRVALAAGWGLAAIAELLGAPRGAGRIIQVFAGTSSVADIIGVVICLGALAVIIDGAVAGVGRWLVRWQT